MDPGRCWRRRSAIPRRFVGTDRGWVIQRVFAHDVSITCRNEALKSRDCAVDPSGLTRRPRAGRHPAHLRPALTLRGAAERPSIDAHDAWPSYARIAAVGYVVWRVEPSPHTCESTWDWSDRAGRLHSRDGGRLVLSGFTPPRSMSGSARLAVWRRVDMPWLSRSPPSAGARGDALGAALWSVSERRTLGYANRCSVARAGGWRACAVARANVWAMVSARPPGRARAGLRIDRRVSTCPALGLRDRRPRPARRSAASFVNPGTSDDGGRDRFLAGLGLLVGHRHRVLDRVLGRNAHPAADRGVDRGGDPPRCTLPWWHVRRPSRAECWGRDDRRCSSGGGDRRRAGRYRRGDRVGLHIGARVRCRPVHRRTRRGGNR